MNGIVMSKRREERKIMGREKLVVIGAGMAAARFVEQLTTLAPSRYAISVIGEEPRLAYNRVLLSSALAGDVGLDEIELKPAHWWREVGVAVVSGRKAVHVDVAAHMVRLDNGETLGFSKLVFATGSSAARLPISGAELPGVHTFRDVRDVEALSQLGAARKRVLVIGGGLLGLEAAYGLARRGADVTLAHVMDRLMERQLDAAAAAILRRLVEEKGARVMLQATTTRISGRDRVEQIHFADGSSMEADAVVFAVGVRPNAELARAAGLAVNRGVLVDDRLASSVPTIFAIGECAEHLGTCYGLVEPAYEQARILAARLAGEADAAYRGSVTSTNLKVSGVRVFSAGDFIGAAGAKVVVCADPLMGVYKKLVVQGERLTGAILIGDTSAARACLELIHTGDALGARRDEVIFGASQQKEAA
jgi:nitrite reductase (NADH) large subunit